MQFHVLFFCAPDHHALTTFFGTCPSGPSFHNKIQFEKSICERIKVYITIQTKIASTLLLGTIAENFVKSLAKCYKALLALVRLVSGGEKAIPDIESMLLDR
jgi:hypothetical protein